jgi:hypothetical protein
MDIKAIETRYAGCRFRSRTEARWAVYFDALGIKWEYEPQGFEFSLGRYLPDFFLGDFGFYAEVKPEPSIKDIGLGWRLGVFARDIGRPILLLNGMPRAETVTGYFPYSVEMKSVLTAWKDIDFAKPMYGMGEAFEFFRSEFPLVGPGWPAELMFPMSHIYGTDDYAGVSNAVQKAKSARFEFGECG